MVLFIDEETKLSELASDEELIVVAFDKDDDTV